MRINSLIKNEIYSLGNNFLPSFGQKQRTNTTASFVQSDVLPDFRPLYYVYHPKCELNKVCDTGLGSSFDVKELLDESLNKKSCLGEGGEAYIFNIDNEEKYVLRVSKAHSKKISGKNIFKKPVLIPVFYDEKLFNTKNLGLPLYVVEEAAESMQSQRKSYNSSDIPNQWGLVTILRKMPGETVTFPYKDALARFMNVGEYYNDDGLKNFENFLSTLRDARFMADEFSGCDAFMKDEDFAKNYRQFAKSYLYQLKKIADLPKEAYDNALSVIENAEGFMFDFNNSSNILIDFERQEFNFVDLQFNPEIAYYYENDDVRKAFRDNLLGGDSAYGIAMNFPGELLADNNDFDEFLRLKTIINKKCGIEDEFEFY